MFQKIRSLIPKLFGFSLVGIAGFVVDIAALTLALHFFDTTIARLFSFLCAVVSTYSLNRHFVFAQESANLKWLEGFVKFFLSNALGGAANFATYLAILHFQPGFHWTPQMAIIPGTFVGLVFNFSLTVLFVFRRKRQ